MSKIYISYTKTDSFIATRISDVLKDAGHEILIDIDTLLPGQDISSTLFDALRQSDFMVVIISESSVNSKWVQNEIGAALSYSSERKNFGLFPVVIGNPQLPESIRHKLYIRAEGDNADAIAAQVLDGVNKFMGRRAAIKERGEEKKRNTDDYITQELLKLEAKQISAKRIYYLWNFIGFIALVISAVFLLLKFSETNVSLDIWIAGTLLVKSVLIISFLIAISRYSFLMGKIALDESITFGGTDSCNIFWQSFHSNVQ